MKTLIYISLALVFFGGFEPGLSCIPQDSIQNKAIYGKQARIICYVLDNNHYQKIRLGDSLSAIIIDEYINDLDPNKLYFLHSDVQSFQKYKTKIDDLTRNEDVSPAFEIFSVYQKRFRERQQRLTDSKFYLPFDFTLDEYYETNRKDIPWSTTLAEQDDVWRKVIKSQALNYKLTQLTDSAIYSNLKIRYERFLNTFNKIKGQDVFSIYMNAITTAYDPHTNYLSPTSLDLFKQSMSLSLEGIGARLQMDNDFTRVVDLVPGGPADKSNKIFPDDLILAVGSNKEELINVQGWRLDEVVKLIKGPKGTKVRLQIQSAKTGLKGKPEIIELIRDVIHLEDQAAKKQVFNMTQNGREKKVGVITIPTFYMDFDQYNKGNKEYRSTTRDVRKLLTQLTKENIEGLIIDLRNNGGGSLLEAIQLSGLFIKEGPIVQVKDYMSKVEILPDTDANIVYDGPLVILTNRRSASASEIFAGAMQDYHRGVVVGESTFGKGTVQTILNLNRFVSDKESVGSLKFTFQKFYRISGSSTQNLGIQPDIQLPSPLTKDQFGERSTPSALPWDEISKTSYASVSDVNPNIISTLNSFYSSRQQDDLSLKKFITQTEEQRILMSDTKVSLNEATRRQEMENASQKKNVEEKKAISSTSSESKDPLHSLDDEYLRQGILILLDLLQIG